MELKLKIIIIYLCLCAVNCYPSRPLNDRPNESWQAWLLIDSQNNNNNNNQGENDRRITPKSVFIAPNIGDNGSLPDCAEGYRSDPMGRCIKFVKVDEAAHLDFLLQRLNEIYATNPSEELDDDDTKPTTGPLQVNIPLGGGSSPEENPEIAIIVAPTNGNFEEEEQSEIPEINKRTKEKQNTKVSENNDEDTTTTTTLPTTITSNTESTTQTIPTTIPQDLQAIFFLVPNNDTKTNHDLKNRTNIDTPTSLYATSTEFQTSGDTIAETTDRKTTIQLPQEEEEEDEEEIINNNTEDSPNYDEEQEEEEVYTTTSQRNNIIRFPSDITTIHSESTTEKLKEPTRLSSSEIENLFKQYINNQNPPEVLLTTDRQINRRRPIAESTFIQPETTYTQSEPPETSLIPDIQRPYYPPFNHRNRERNSEFWRPTWREDNSQKPLILRFGKHQTPTRLVVNSERALENSRFFNEQRDLSSGEYGRKRRRDNFR